MTWSWSWISRTVAISRSACRARSTARTTSTSSAHQPIISRACWSGAASAEASRARNGSAAMDLARGRRAAFPALLLAVSLAIADEAATDPVRAAEPARLAARGLLVAIATAGQRLVAVGDRGIIVLSDERGASWR